MLFILASMDAELKSTRDEDENGNCDCGCETSTSGGEIQVVCCYCQKTMETKKGTGVSGVSHGICYDCFIKTREAWRAEIEAYKRKWVDQEQKPTEEESPK